MFGIGIPEMLLILAVALIVIGPKKLPDLAKSLGKALGEFKRATSDLKETLEVNTGLDDVKTAFDNMNQEIRSPLDGLTYPDTEKSGDASASPDEADTTSDPPESVTSDQRKQPESIDKDD
ncbi:MAG: twin-arginine translocase subunit TatB [Deltaproteobacteria bacterium]|nr:twin-arginine translocase subunit TatB [Deltaproteobacteria bacterium]